jgi:cell wall-associated NlpC family hydrolase
MATLSAAVALALVTAPIALAAQRAPAGGEALAARDGLVAVRGRVGGEDVVREARRHLGVRYVLGGTTPRAFDCSGFVRYVFGAYGIRLPRTAHEQAGVGTTPFPGDLQTGDLLFFSGGKGAQHIAIYVGGDTIIHASSTGRRVRLDVLARRGGRTTWFRRRLIAVRRVLPMEGTFYVPTSMASAGPDEVASTTTAALAAPTVASRASGDVSLEPGVAVPR